ncbi:MAG TPA: hypothetical protein VGQ37_02625 [Vicinamibacterales bacterium]|nr:hypothetical protein [Vicinamibacterales bacterium]
MLSMPRVDAAAAPKLSAADYQEIAQLTNRYAYGIDTRAFSPARRGGQLNTA